MYVKTKKLQDFEKVLATLFKNNWANMSVENVHSTLELKEFIFMTGMTSYASVLWVRLSEQESKTASSADYW